MSAVTIKFLIQNLIFFLTGSLATSGTGEHEWLAKEHRGKDHMLNNLYSKYTYIKIINTEVQVSRL